MGGPSEKDYMYCRASPEWNSTVQFCDHAVMLDRHVSQVCVMGREKENDVCVCVRAHVCVCASAHFTHDDENSGVPHLHPHPPLLFDLECCYSIHAETFLFLSLFLK